MRLLVRGLLPEKQIFRDSLIGTCFGKR